MTKDMPPMTAPAATLPQRHAHLHDHARPALRERELAQNPRQVAGPAQVKPRDAGASAGFAAQLKRQIAPTPPGRPNRAPTSAGKPSTGSAASAPFGRALADTAEAQMDTRADAAASAPDSGKALPGKRQNAAPAVLPAVQTMLNVRTSAALDETPTDTAVPDALSAPAALADTMIAVIAAPLAALATPAAAVPAARAAPPAGIAARLGTVPPNTIALNTIGLNTITTPAAGAPLAPSDQPLVSAANAAKAAAGTPVSAFVLEADGPAPAPVPAVLALASDPAVDAETRAATNPAQAAPWAPHSTRAALTGEPDAARNSVRAGSSEAKTARADATAEPEPALLETPAPAVAANQPWSAAASNDPAAPLSPAAAQRIDFDALVDSIARARDGAADAAPVAVAMQHGEFGRISLRIQTDADGLSVAMTSADPGFAPAVAAAHAAEAAEVAAAAASAETAPRSPQNGNASSTASEAGNGNANGSGNANGQTPGSARGGSGQRQENPQAPQHAAGQPVRAAHPETAAADARRGGIFA